MATYRVSWDDGRYEETVDARTDDGAIAIAYADAARWLDPGTKTQVQIFRKDEAHTEVFLGYVRKLIPWRDLTLIYDNGRSAGYEIDADSRTGLRRLRMWRESGSTVEGRTRVYLRVSGDLEAEADLVDWEGFDEAMAQTLA